MDPQKSLCVLPSNAPALQEHAENPGLHKLDSTSIISSLASCTRRRTPYTKINTQTHLAGAVPQNHERRRPQRNAGNAKVELQSEKYVAYRKKNRNVDKKSQVEQKWPDELEEAFQLALRMIPNLGRRLTPCSVAICGHTGTKNCGRNEHIQHFIEWRTGIKRDRKKISSHLQVLKNFQKENKPWMALVTKTEENQPETQESRRGMNLHTVDENHHVFDKMPHGIMDSNVLYDGHSVRRIKFEMYIIDREGLETLHTYSSLQSEIGSAPKALEEVNDWRITFPPLATYFDRGELDGEVILFDTNFKLLDNHPPHKSNLRIDFTIDVAQGMDYRDWECHTKFYENGVLKESISNPTNSKHLPGTNEARIVVLLHSRWWVDYFVKITTQRLLKEQRGDPLDIDLEAERARRCIQDISVVQEIWATQADNSSSRRMAILLWNFNKTRNNEAATTTWRKLIPPAPPTEPYFSTQPSPPCIIERSLAIDTNLRHHDLLQPKPLYAEYYNPQSSFFTEDPEKLFIGPESRLTSPPSTPVADYRSFPSSTSTSIPSSISNDTLPLEFSQDSAYRSQESYFHSRDAAYTPQDFGLESQHSIYRSSYPSKDSIGRSQDPSIDTKSRTGSQDQSSQSHYYHPQGPSDNSRFEQHLEYLFNSSSALEHELNENHYPPPEPTDPNTEAPTHEFSNINIQLSITESEDHQLPYIAPCVAPLVNMLHHQDHETNHEKTPESSHEDRVQTPPNQDSFDMSQWQAVDQAVQWANTKFHNGDYEEIRNMIKHGQVSEDIGDIVDIERGTDVGMGLIESYDQGRDQ